MPLTSTGTCLRGPWLYPTPSELCLTVSHVERDVSFFSRVQGERNIEILNFYLRSFIARYNSDPVKTCLSN